MSLIGHEAVMSRIPDPLPRTLLLTGPEGVGKRLAALELAERAGAEGPDFQNLGSLDRQGVRDLLAHHSTYPLTGPCKVSVADISHSRPEAVNALLKLLEDPPEYSRIVLHSDTDPLLTVKSRCFAVRFGTLSVEEVSAILDRLGVEDPEEAARLASGRVSLGLAYAHGKGARRVVETVLSAVARADVSMVEAALNEALRGDKGATEEQTEVKRLVVCSLLGISLRTSLRAEEHALAHLPLTSRLRALEILDGRARPSLRARSATWVLLAG